MLSLMNLSSQRGANCHQRQRRNEPGEGNMIGEQWKNSPLSLPLPPGQ